jgi:putative hemolysin
LSIEFIIVLLLIVANGVFAMSEAAMISARTARLQERAEAGDAGAQAALDLAENPNRFLSTVQIGITLIGILAGAFGGSSIAQQVQPVVERVPVLAPYAGAISLALVVALITYLSLLIGELVPKRLALNAPEQVASTVARPMRLLAGLAAPLVRFLSLSTDVVLRLLGVRPSHEPPVTEEEVRIMLKQGTQTGVFEAEEQDIISNVFRLGDWYVRDVMTPRTEFTWLDLDDPSSVNIEKVRDSSYSYYPVFQADMQNFVGLVSLRDLWEQAIGDAALDLRALARPALFIPETTPALDAIETMRQKRDVVALIIEEHGDIAGIVTLTDILEAIVGDVPAMPTEITRRADGSWLMDGMVNMDEVEELFEQQLIPDDEASSYDTLGGFVMKRLDRVPRAADQFDWGGLVFEVVDMDGNRVDKVLVRRA